MHELLQEIIRKIGVNKAGQTVSGLGKFAGGRTFSDKTERDQAFCFVSGITTERLIFKK